MNATEPTDAILVSSRFWFQKVLVPIMVCIGVGGNTVTVMVLTRRRMRSSTNIYLSALAIADIIHLFFVFVLSFQHYDHIHDRRYELYWRFYGISHWLCDAASSTSVWLTVSFTIERYIAVCHPIKGKFFCTENRAKTVTVIVYIFCILTTASTTFEHQLKLNNTCPECETAVTNNSTNSNNGTVADALSIRFVRNSANLTERGAAATTNSISTTTTTTTTTLDDAKLVDSLKRILDNCTGKHPHIIYVYPANCNYENLTVIHEELHATDEDVPSSEASSVEEQRRKSCTCKTKPQIDVESTNLGKNETYSKFIGWYSALVWGIVPLVLIATFNCFLIRAVYTSRKCRRSMTRTNTQNSQSENSSASNENRITMMLIAVIVMFLVCQTPTASFLIYSTLPTSENRRQRNIKIILGNVFNFLLTVNASCNFLLYSIMSKKFRSTFKQVFFECTNKKRQQQDTIQLSSLKSHSNSQKFNPYRHGLPRNNRSEYLRTPRNLETTSLTGVPRSKSLIVRPVGKCKSSDIIV